MGSAAWRQASGALLQRLLEGKCKKALDRRDQAFEGRGSIST
jgi:hypothetical protein